MAVCVGATSFAQGPFFEQSTLALDDDELLEHPEITGTTVAKLAAAITPAYDVDRRILRSI